MAGMMSDLVELVTEEAVLIEELVTVAHEKKDYIIDNDIENLKQLNARENTLVGKIQRLERNRQPLIADIAKVMNENEDDITLTRLSSLLKGEAVADELSELIKRLNDGLEELKQRNDQNKILLGQSLEYIDFSMNVIQGARADGPAVFSANGEPLDDEPGFLDIRN